MVDVAQLVEPRIVDPVVVGSSPIVHPKYAGFSSSRFKVSDFFGPLAQLVEQLTLNQLVVGSSPTRPTIFSASRVVRSLLLLPAFLFQGVRRLVYFAAHRWRLTHFEESFLDGEPRSHAKVAELADALDLGSSGVTRAGSSPAFRTTHQ